MCADSRGSAQSPQEMRSNGRNGFSGGARARSGGLPARGRSRACGLGVAMSRRPVMMCRPQLASSAAAGRGPRLRRPGQPPAGYRKDSLLPGRPPQDRMAAGRRRHQPGSMMRASPVTELLPGRPAGQRGGEPGARRGGGRVTGGPRRVAPRLPARDPGKSRPARGFETASSGPVQQPLGGRAGFSGLPRVRRSHNTAWNSTQKVAESPEAVRSLKRSGCCYSGVATYLTAAAQAR